MTDNIEPGADAEAVDQSENTTTPQEVAQVLQRSGMNVATPAEPKDDKPADKPAEPAADADKPTDETPAPADKPIEPAKPNEAAKPNEPAGDTKDAKPEDTAPRQFTIEVEDANGVTFKIDASDDIEEVLAEFEPKNNGQIIKLLDQYRDLKAEKVEYDKTQTENEETARVTAEVAQIQEGWNAEVQDLQATNRMPKAADELAERRLAVMNYMGEQNQDRAQKGQPLISSIQDALNGLEVKEAQEAKAEAAKAAKETARNHGGMVGGSSAPAGAKPAVWRSGSGVSNAQQALKQAGLL